MINPDPAEWTEIGEYYVGSNPDIDMHYDTSQCQILLAKNGRFDNSKGNDIEGDSITLGFRCDHCGAAHAWGFLFQHKDGKCAQIGHRCAGKIFMRPDRASVLRAKAEKDARLKKLIRGWTVAGLRRIISVARQNRNVIGFLRSSDAFAMSLRSQAFRKYGWSEAQINALLKCADRYAQRAERKAEYDAEVKGEAPDGKQTVRGVIIMVKLYDSMYGETYKMLVKLENNSLVFCTLPSTLNPEDKGKAIELTATFQRKGEDKSFAFGKRPRAKLLTQEAVTP